MGMHFFSLGLKENLSMNEEIEIILQKAGIHATPVRFLVYKCLKESKRPVSLSDIEISLNTVDKSTISRTLNLFKTHHMVHSINDGSGSVKYEICKGRDEEDHEDMHVHFRCETCGETYCMNSVKIPQVKLPAGYHIHEINYIMSGICADCTQKRDFRK